MWPAAKYPAIPLVDVKALVELEMLIMVRLFCGMNPSLKPFVFGHIDVEKQFMQHDLQLLSSA